MPETIFPLLQINNTIDYLPIVILLFVAILISGIVAFIVAGRKGIRETKVEVIAEEKEMVENEIDTNVSDNVYLLPAFIFILFLSGMIFLFPYSVNFKSLGWPEFIAVLIYVALFFCGFIYATKKGTLDEEPID